MSKGQEYKAYGSICKMKVGGTYGVILALSMLGMVVSTGSVSADEVLTDKTVVVEKKSEVDVPISHDSLDKAVKEAKEASVVQDKGVATSETVLEKQKETEDKNKVSETADYDSTTHPENTNTPTPGTFTEDNTHTEETPGAPIVPKLPDGFNLDHRELNRLNETTESEPPANTETTPDLNPVPKDHPIATDDLSEEELAELSRNEDQ